MQPTSPQQAHILRASSFFIGLVLASTWALAALNDESEASRRPPTVPGSFLVRFNNDVRKSEFSRQLDGSGFHWRPLGRQSASGPFAKQDLNRQARGNQEIGKQ